MPKHHCRAYNCTNSVEKQKQPEKYPEMANTTFHTFPPDNPKKRYASGMREREIYKRWIVACRLESLNVMRHTRICSSHFGGGLGPTKTNLIPTLFAFPKHPAKSNNISRWSWGQSLTVCTDANGSPYPRDKNSKKGLRISTGGCCRRTNPRNETKKTQSHLKLFWTSRSTEPQYVERAVQMVKILR